jgi:hypothetical protein
MHTVRPRLLQIIEWTGGRPFRATCTQCERIFALNDPTISDVASARDNLEDQFRAHVCAEKSRQPRRRY